MGQPCEFQVQGRRARETVRCLLGWRHRGIPHWILNADSGWTVGCVHAQRGHDWLAPQCSDLTPIFIGMDWNAPLSPMKEGARVHRSYGSYAPSTYGSYEPRRANPSTG
jgi:hypothetical protein